MPALGVDCAWCRKKIKAAAAPEAEAEPESQRVSHGICIECMAGLLDIPLFSVLDLDETSADRLPFGRLELTGDGIVRAYNEWESQLSGLEGDRVLGRHFFTSVAPCTGSTAFEDHWNALLRQGGGETGFEFIFAFPSGHRMVDIRMIVEPERDRHLILVRDVDDSSRR